MIHEDSGTLSDLFPVIVCYGTAVSLCGRLSLVSLRSPHVPDSVRDGGVGHTYGHSLSLGKQRAAIAPLLAAVASLDI